MNKEKILNLIKKLHPIKTEYELIRVGPRGDGGYLLPNDLGGILDCFSPGVGAMSGFELECAKRGMDIFLADASVNNPQFNDSKFHFIKKYIGLNKSNDFVPINNWIEENYKNNSDILFQMDIEGAEYDNILNLNKYYLDKIRIFVIEFHDLNKLWEEEFFNKAEKVFNRLLENHVCVHIHPNNSNRLFSKEGIDIPPVTEFTFFRIDRFKELNFANEFPNNLDCDNTSAPTIILPKCWFN
jgi:hypothetical protein